jgi:hypothetical protein
MPTTKDVCRNALEQRISNLETTIKVAKERLEEDDFFQCAITLKKSAKETKFDYALMSVFESMSGHE